MQAIQITKFGGPEVIKQATVDKPIPKGNELLIKVHAAGVNPVDWKMREGQIPFQKLPKVPGGEVAGEIVQAPSDSGLVAGDRVFANMGAKFGGFAEYVVVPCTDAAKIPATLSFTDAASVPLAGLTAWQCLDAAGVKEGDHVLIHAGSGGVGSSAIQLAKIRGLKVSTTCSAKNAEFCKELGADRVIDYQTEKFEEVLKDEQVDAVIDGVGEDYENRSLALLKTKKGKPTYISMLAGASVSRIIGNKFKSMLWLGPRYKIVLLKPNGQQLAQMGEYIRSGKFKTNVQQVFSLDKTGEALEVQKTHRVRGKLVVNVVAE